MIKDEILINLIKILEENIGNMKSYKITFKTNNLIIPINYHYQLQSLIYSIIRNGGGNKLHDFNDNLKNFKFFSFSLLYGGSFHDKKLYFKSHMHLTIRFLDDEISNNFEQGLKLDMQLFNQKIELESIEIKCDRINCTKILIKMLSPINVDRTVDDIRINYNPKNKRYNELINQNLKDKYKMYFNIDIPSLITLEQVGNNKKYVTLYKENPSLYITAYGGYFILKGDSKLIDFLYYTGLGARNSCGFGLFDIVEVLK